MDEFAKRLLDIIQKRWYRTSTLLLVGLAVFVLLLWLFSAIAIEEISTREYLISTLVLVGISIFWYFSTRIPKAPKGKIGFALGITTDDPVQQQKLKRDFAQTLQTILQRSRYKYNFAFIEIPNHYIEKIISHEDAVNVLHAARCSFMIYGRARTTIINGKSQHILNLEGAVLHRPVPNEINKSFSKEFAELLPRRVAIATEGDLFNFEVTAQLIDLVAKYIIGVAALLSGDNDYAQELFEGLERAFQNKQQNANPLIKIKQRLPNRLEYVYLAQLRIIYDKWKLEKNNEILVEMDTVLKKIALISPQNIDARFYKSVFYFLNGRQIGKAKKETLKTKIKKHTAWQYNYAFLLAYEGNMKESLKQYREAVNEIFEEPRVVLEVIEFIMWVIEIEPEKAQLYFCLGYIYYYAVRDYALALQEFEKFLENTLTNKFKTQRREAEKFVSKINNDIKSGKIKIENEFVTS